MAQNNEFGVAVRCKLIERGENLTSLADRVHGKTGLFCDTSYLNKILSGERNAPKVCAAIVEILDIRDA